MKINSMKKQIAIILIVFICIYSILGFFSFESNTSKAAYVGYSDDIAGINDALYPGYKALIQNLQNNPAYSNWKFRLYYTGLDWNEAVISQCQGHNGSPKSLFQYSANWYDGDWYCPVCGTQKYDTGSWRCASEAAVSYMLDPRNSINKDDIFQFQETSYNSTIGYNEVQKMVSGKFLDNPTLINAILNVASTKNMNALFIVGRILQEQGSNGSVLSSGLGYNGKYVGVYNLFNVKATGNTNEEVILNGLRHAEEQGWTTPELSITAGISLIADSYVANGQNTGYFQKFNVVNGNSLYANQYMQNILAPQNEGTKLRDAYINNQILNGSYTFIIPVYENMPATASPRPNPNTGFTTKEFDKATLNVNNTLALRSSPNGTELRYISSGSNIIILARATSKVGGFYWDKVIAYEGNKGYTGYMAREATDGSKTYLVIHTYGKDTINGALSGPNNKFKVENNNLVMEPKTTINDIRNAGYTITSITQNGADVSSRQSLGTGTVIVTDKGTFTVIKMGDTDGDGAITAVDLLMVKRYIEGKYVLQDVYKEAARVNNEIEVTAVDLLRVKRHIEGKTYITI